jgi:hypothetical protein
VQAPQTAFIPSIIQEEEEEEEERNDLDNRDDQEIFSIIGHLERDEQKLYEKLRDSPDLAEPIIEAQAQLNRLKGLMFNIFGRRSSSSATAAIGAGSGGGGGNGLELTNQDAKLSPVVPTFTSSSFLSSTAHQRQNSLQLVETPALPSESTRLDDGLAAAAAAAEIGHGDQPSAAANFRLGQQAFSPIAHLDTSAAHYFHRRSTGDIHAADDDESCSTALGGSRQTDDDAGLMTFDRSLTRFRLSDLSRRLGGTGLCYSRDSLLEITERLQGGNSSSRSAPGGGKGNERGGNSGADTVDELEKLMLSLSGIP